MTNIEIERASRQEEFFKLAVTLPVGSACAACFKTITTTIPGDGRCGKCYSEDRHQADGRPFDSDFHEPRKSSTWFVEDGCIRERKEKEASPKVNILMPEAEKRVVNKCYELALKALNEAEKALDSGDFEEQELMGLVALADNSFMLAEKILAIYSPDKQ